MVCHIRSEVVAVFIIINNIKKKLEVSAASERRALGERNVCCDVKKIHCLYDLGSSPVF